MTKHCALPLVLLIAFAATAIAQEEMKEKTRPQFNNVSYGQITTGKDIDALMKSFSEYEKADPVSWRDFNKDAFDYARIWAPVPPETPLSARAVSKMTALLVSAPEPGCDMVPRLLFVNFPAQSGGGTAGFSLFSYEYNVCDITNLLRPGDMIDQYIARYGMYDEKDFDRQMIIYNNVKKQYRVGVRPFESGENLRGVTITIVDNRVFEDAYRSWRGALRRADDMARSQF